jgi:hypothetical protein
MKAALKGKLDNQKSNNFDNNKENIQNEKGSKYIDIPQCEMP